MNVTIMIPSRIGSTRLPRKSLLELDGKPIAYLIYEKCFNWGKANNVFVATDSEEIKEAVESRGGKAIMTSIDHENGTSRCFEAFEKIGSPKGILMNIQGDEPFIENNHLDCLLDTLVLNPHIDVSTSIYKIKDENDLASDTVVKADFEKETKKISDFSRTPISEFGHMGVYGFRTELLEKIKSLPSTKREIEERLEQLKWMEGGITIGADVVPNKTIAIDVLADYEKAKDIIKNTVG